MRLLFAAAWIAALGAASSALYAQSANLINASVDSTQVRVLPNHHPLWATAQNSVGLVSSDVTLTMVLERTPAQETAFQKLLADQQDPASPDYHHWLTPVEIGARFGPSSSDLAAVTGWLQSQGLQVNWVAPSGVFIGVGGAASDVGHAFQTEMHRYSVNGLERISVSSDPMIPAALAPAIKAIHGLYTIDEQPAHHAALVQSDSPEMTTSSGYHFIGPGDFAAIYGLPTNFSGAGQTIGIVGRSRTNPADFNNFNARVGPGFTNPTEIVPTGFGGVDPGPALTTPPAAGVDLGEQGEATLDVLRTGSTARSAQLLLVVATAASGGIGADAQYLVQTTPVPAQIMTISFGACEAAGGSAGVRFWDTLFQQAAAEGISTFVSSGDSGAAGCDLAFEAPPASPKANSPNYICSSSYATCVGGTEFNDTANPSLYWNSAYVGQTAHGYIPEGGWNESWDGTTSTVVGSGGGVSTVIPTPSWQSGIGVPEARSGRYTPDISFSSSMHDGYFACFAAGGGSCVVGTDGSFRFMSFGGTSAAAPAMAGVAALLNQYNGAAQGNLNPGLYHMAVSAPTAFNDVTVATSGVTTCDLNIPSMCNNSIGGPSGLSGGQPGYAVGVGYDEVTGLGSLNAGTFVYAYSTTSKVMKPALTLSGMVWANTWEPFFLAAQIYGSGYSPEPTGTITFTVGSYTSGPIALQGGGALVNVPAGTIPVGTYTSTAVYTPDAASAQIYQSATATSTFTMVVPPKVQPKLTLTPSQTIISNSQSMSVAVVVDADQYYSTPSGRLVPYYPMPTGSVVLTSGSYTSAPVVLVGGNANFSVPAGSLATGNDALTVTYTPDTASSSTFLVASGATYVENQGARITPSVFPSSSPYNPTTAQAVAVLVTVNGFTGNPTPTGSVVLTSGSYTSAAAAIADGTASIAIPAGTLPPGLDTLTATYTPDAASSALYAIASGSNTIGVSLAVKITPALTGTSLTANPTTVQPLSLSITVSGGAGNPAPSGFVRLQNANYNSVDAVLTGGSATATIPVGSLSGGTDTITATYWPDTNGAYSYNSASGTIAVAVAKATPVVTITPSLTSMSTLDSLDIFANVSAGPGTTPASGTVTIMGGPLTKNPLVVYSSGNTASVAIPYLTLPPGTVTFTASYSGDNTYTAATGTTTVTVTMPANANFGITGTNLSSLWKGAINGNYSTVTLTPTNGFVGTVALTAAVTASPAGAQYPPTLSFAPTSSVNLQGPNQAISTLTVTTTSSTSGALAYPPRPGARWYSAGTAALACILLFCIPARRRKWHSILGSLMLLIALSSGVLACSGGGGTSTGGGGGGGGIAGTTSGVYTITIIGTSGSTTASSTITVTVQ